MAFDNEMSNDASQLSHRPSFQGWGLQGWAHVKLNEKQLSGKPHQLHANTERKRVQWL